MFSIKTITQLALMLSLLLVSSILTKFIPPLPNGLGNWLVMFELLIILFSFSFGIRKTLLVVSIYYFVLAWTAPPLFIGGIVWVKGFWNIFGVYFLDYVIPYLLLACSGVVKKGPKAIMICLMCICLGYLSSVWSGIIFWGAYSWNGWSVVAYSFLANGIRFMIIALMSITLVKFALPRLEIFLNRFTEESHARY